MKNKKMHPAIEAVLTWFFRHETITSCLLAVVVGVALGVMLSALQTVLK